MTFRSILKAVVRAAPVILAHAPAVIAAVKRSRRAARAGPETRP